jgi:hypothetical protein
LTSAASSLFFDFFGVGAAAADVDVVPAPRVGASLRFRDPPSASTRAKSFGGAPGAFSAFLRVLRRGGSLGLDDIAREETFQTRIEVSASPRPVAVAARRRLISRRVQNRCTFSVVGLPGFGFKVLLSKRDPPFKIYFQNTNPCRHPCRPCA